MTGCSSHFVFGFFKEGGKGGENPDYVLPENSNDTGQMSQVKCQHGLK